MKRRLGPNSGALSVAAAAAAWLPAADGQGLDPSSLRQRSMLTQTDGHVVLGP